MRRASVCCALVAAVWLGAVTLPAAASAQLPHRRSAQTATCPWVNSTAPIAQRVAQLMSNMTVSDEDFLVEGHGTTNEGANPSPNPYVFWMPGIPSLCIPKLGEEDGPAGVADGLTGVTQLPAGVALAASWSPSLARQYGQVIGSEEARQGRRRKPRPDHQHRPRPPLGALVRGVHRGSVPERVARHCRDRRRAEHR